MNVSDTVIMEGWLVRSREQGMRFPPFKSKWVRRYFVLRICDRNIGSCVLDEFRKDDKRRLRKSLDLTRCVQIDSYLQLADSSCSTTMRFGGFQWIFSLYLSKGTSEKKIQTYFVAESEDNVLGGIYIQKMRDWVLHLCRACRLEKQSEEESNNHTMQEEGYLHRCELPASSFAALSMSSGRSSESVFDTPRSDITSDDVRDSFADASARSAHSLEEEGDILFDFCFTTNVRRKSRFTRRVLGLSENRQPSCRYEMIFHSQRTSKSNPVTPSDGKQHCDGFVSKACGGSNPTLSGLPSLENIWHDVPDKKPLSSLWAISQSRTSKTVNGFREPFELHLNREMTSPSVDISDNFAAANDIQAISKSLPKNYLHMRNFRSNTTPRNMPSNISVREVESTNHRRTDSIDGPRASSSASACSSLASSHRSMTTEDDSSSCFSHISTVSSGPPIPPRTRLAPQFSSASSSTGITSRHTSRGAERLNQPIPPPAREIIDEIVDNESSGETIKLHGISSHAPLNSAETFFPHYVLLDSPMASTVRIPTSSQDLSAPPAIDRSKKPAKLRLDGDDDRVPTEMTIHGYNKYGSSFIRTPRTPQLPKTTPKPRYSVDPPKSAGPFGRSKELDYFEPLTVPLERAHSVRSPEPIDIEYIKIDADRTQAVKHSIAQRMTID